MSTKELAVVDERAVQAFAEQLLDTYTRASLTLMIDLAHRTGLLETWPMARIPRRSWPSGAA